MRTWQQAKQHAASQGMAIILRRQDRDQNRYNYYYETTPETYEEAGESGKPGCRYRIGDSLIVRLNTSKEKITYNTISREGTLWTEIFDDITILGWSYTLVLPKQHPEKGRLTASGTTNSTLPRMRQLTLDTGRSTTPRDPPSAGSLLGRIMNLTKRKTPTSSPAASPELETARVAPSQPSQEETHTTGTTTADVHHRADSQVPQSNKSVTAFSTEQAPQDLDDDTANEADNESVNTLDATGIPDETYKQPKTKTNPARTQPSTAPAQKPKKTINEDIEIDPVQPKRDATPTHHRPEELIRPSTGASNWWKQQRGQVITKEGAANPLVREAGILLADLENLSDAIRRNNNSVDAGVPFFMPKGKPIQLPCPGAIDEDLMADLNEAMRSCAERLTHATSAWMFRVIADKEKRLDEIQNSWNPTAEEQREIEIVKNSRRHHIRLFFDDLKEPGKAFRYFKTPDTTNGDRLILPDPTTDTIHATGRRYSRGNNTAGRTGASRPRSNTRDPATNQQHPMEKTEYTSNVDRRQPGEYRPPNGRPQHQRQWNGHNRTGRNWNGRRNPPSFKQQWHRTTNRHTGWNGNSYRPAEPIYHTINQQHQEGHYPPHPGSFRTRTFRNSGPGNR